MAEVKHPLEHRWSLWYYKNDKSFSWEENLVDVSSFDTIEDFWALYHHVERPSKVRCGCDYALFKSGIKPMWEDPRNRQGGRWLFNLNKSKGSTDVDNKWLEVLLCLIGEAFDEFGGDVCGAVVQNRSRLDKIAVWTTDCRRADANMKIGETVKERMNLPQRFVVGYQSHADTQSKKGSANKVMYQV